MDMKLNGSCGFARRSDGFIVMTIRDEDSSTSFCEVKFTPEQFANAITGLFSTKCELDVRGLDKLGKKMENMTVDVFAPDGNVAQMKANEISKLMWADMTEQWTKDGWTVEKYNWGNMHKRIKSKFGELGYECVARRWV